VVCESLRTQQTNIGLLQLDLGVSVMKTSMGKALLYLVVLQSSLAVAAEEIPMPTVELESNLICQASQTWKMSDGPRRPDCLSLGLGYPLSQQTSLRVYAGAGPTGFGFRYRYNEVTFAELRLNRGGNFFSLVFNHDF
jgi:hypothetical protein